MILVKRGHKASYLEKSVMDICLAALHVDAAGTAGGWENDSLEFPLEVVTETRRLREQELSGCRAALPQPDHLRRAKGQDVFLQ